MLGKSAQKKAAYSAGFEPTETGKTTKKRKTNESIEEGFNRGH